jgi:hypothetical protein
MVTLWQRDRETVWALNALTYHRGHRGAPPIGSSHRINGYLLTVCAPNRPYGVGTHGPVRVSHLTQQVVLAWKGGRLKGAQARWLCARRTSSFVLENEMTLPLCGMCHYRVSGSAAILTVNIGSVHIGGAT